MTGNGSDPHAAYYPIRVVSAETGINAITLRAWERRYGLIEPKRTAKGHRLYTEQDINLIRRVVALLNRGIPISQAQAMLNGESTQLAEPQHNTPGPSRWQQYREQLYKAVQNFDDHALGNLYEEIGRFFPLEMSLRFLFIPLYYQLKEARTSSLGEVRLACYCGFLEARMAWRLVDNSVPQQRPRILMANISQESEINLLLQGVLLTRMEIGITRLAGLVNIFSIQELIKDQQKWPALIIQTSAHPDADIVRQLKNLNIETGCPLFICGTAPELDNLLREQGLIPTGPDIQQAALNVRDIVQEITA